MEWCADGTLADIIPIKDNGLLKRLLKQLVDAISYLHQFSISHGDLKCINIGIGLKDNIKLLDFGFSRIHKFRSQAASTTPISSPAGTLVYNSFE